MTGGTGFVPPHNIVAEESVLGAMLLNKQSAAAGGELLAPDDFYRPANAATFGAIVRLMAVGSPVDVVTVADELRRVDALDAVGDVGALLRMQNATPVSVNVAQYAAIVRDGALRRRLYAAGAAVQGYAIEAASAAEAAAQAEEEVMRVDRPDGSDVRAGDATRAVMRAGAESVGWVTPWQQVDRIADSLHPGRLTIVAARPGAGKTACALQVAAKVAESTEVRFASAEMTEAELATRLLAQVSGVPAKLLRLRENAGKVAAAQDFIDGLRLTFDDTASMTVPQIAARARRHKVARGLGMLVVDYLQLVTPSPKTNSREADVAAMSRGLKMLARQLEVPVLVCAQLNRDVDKRADKLPVLSDLRESGAIEQDADCVWLLHNPPVDARGAEAQLIVAKNRQGRRGTANLYWDGIYTRFIEFLGEEGPEAF